MQSIVSAVFPDGVSPKKPISLTTVLKGSKRALQQTAASLTLHPLGKPYSRVPPGFRLTMSVAHVSARSVCLFVCFKKGGSFLPSPVPEILWCFYKVKQVVVLFTY